VLPYDCDKGSSRQVKLLLVHETKGCWSMLAGALGWRTACAGGARTPQARLAPGAHAHAAPQQTAFFPEAHARVHMHAQHTRTHAHTHTCTRTHAHVHMHTYTCTHTHTHAHAHTHTRVHTRTHTHTHTHARARAHSRCAGKLDPALDGAGRPEVTAAREAEEESHGLLPAALTRAVLPHCPRLYCRRSKMVIYLLRLSGGGQLPGLLAARLAGACVRVCVCVFGGGEGRAQRSRGVVWRSSQQGRVRE
jgi:hypothetical protein